MSLTHQLQLELALASDEIVDVLHVCYIKSSGKFTREGAVSKKVSCCLIQGLGIDKKAAWHH